MMTFKRKLVSAYGTALFALVGLSVYSYHRVQIRNADQRWVNHTHLVLEQLDAVLVDLVDAETSDRGYILTGDQHYLEPFQNGIHTIRADLEKVRKLTADNPVRQRSLDELDPLINAEVAVMQKGIEVRMREGLTAAAEVIQAGKGRVLTEQIRGEIGEMQKEEQRLLAERSAKAAASLREARWVAGLGNLLFFLALILAGVLTSREMGKRRRAESRFKDLLEAAPDAMVIVNAKGRITFVNGQTERLFGYPRAELLEQTVEVLLPERFRRRHGGHRSGFFAAPKSRPMGAGLELYGRRKDGSEFPVEISLSPIETEEGTLVSSAIRDITDRKRSEEALKASEERMQLAVDSAQMGVWDLDLVKDFAVRSLRHDQIFGFETLQPKWGVEIALTHVVPEDREILVSSIEEARRTGSFEAEFRVIWPDHSIHWASAQGRVYRDAVGSPVRMMGVVSDVTDRKLFEERQKRHQNELARANAELAAANKELEAFSYSVSHDLRAPLRGIDGFSLALLEDYAGKLDEQAKDYLNRIRSGTQRMAMLIDDLLNLSRITRAEMRVEPVDLSALAGAVAAELRRGNPSRMADFVIAEGLHVEGDSQLIRVALENLLGNAWKFTAKRERARIEVGCIQNNGTSAFFVRDNGAGFDAKYVDRLFGAFQRLHSTTDFAGTGIGLATVQRIIHRHGGKVWAEGAVERGATFYFTL